MYIKNTQHPLVMNHTHDKSYITGMGRSYPDRKIVGSESDMDLCTCHCRDNEHVLIDLIYVQYVAETSL